MYTANMKEYKKPDLNAPRFRPKKTSLLNKEFHKKFITKNPKYNHITIEQIKAIIKSYNGKIWENVINYRDGVELPEKLGYLFIGSTKVKGGSIDIKKSLELGYRVNHQNWDSDNHVAKIFYTNYESKYKFSFYELWGFSGVRDFTRSLAQEYPHNWKKYILVGPEDKISKVLFRKAVYKDILKKDTKVKLETYDEFDFS